MVSSTPPRTVRVPLLYSHELRYYATANARGLSISTDREEEPVFVSILLSRPLFFLNPSSLTSSSQNTLQPDEPFVIGHLRRRSGPKWRCVMLKHNLRWTYLAACLMTLIKPALVYSSASMSAS